MVAKPTRHQAYELAPLAPRAQPPMALSILLVDDDPAVLAALGTALDEHRVSFASSLGEAHDHLRASYFDLVLTDVHLAKELGTELHTWLKREDVIVGRFVLMTGNPANVPGCSTEHEILEKPFEVSELFALLEC